MQHHSARQLKFIKILTSILWVIFALLSQSAFATWQSFTLRNGSIVIDVEINGHPAKAILDSGASTNMISKSFVEKYGQDFKKSRSIELKGVYGKKRVSVYSGINLKIFGAEVTLNDAAVGFNSGAQLLLGGGFFNNAIIQIDYPNSRLRRLPKQSVDLKKQANVPMKRARGTVFPAIQVESKGVKAWLIFDTGNSGGILVQRNFATNSGWLTEETEVTERIAFGIFESGTILNFHLDSLKIGPYELSNVSVNVPDQDSVNDFGRYGNEHSGGTRLRRGVQAKGLIGYDVLKHFIVTIDYLEYRVNLYAPGP